MTEWEEFCSKVGMVASSAARKTEELAESAGKHVKLKSLESKMDSLYTVLGKLTYKQLKEGSSQADKIARVMADIDLLKVQRKALKAEIEALKSKRDADKAILEDDDD